jgi:hypothetical protein
MEVVDLADPMCCSNFTACVRQQVYCMCAAASILHVCCSKHTACVLQQDVYCSILACA